jgi:GT2 family glycosyltransferase
MKLDILVVSYHARKELAQTLASIALFSAPGYRLTVHDNTSKNYSLTWLWNSFVRRSRREFIALVNSDVFVGPGWDTEALALLESDKTIGNVSPVSNCPAHKTLGPIPEPNEHALEWIEKLTEGIKTSPTRFHVGTDHTLVVGHCMVFRTSVFRHVAGFDERFPFANNDWDFNQRLVKAGFKMGVALHAPCLHWWNASTKDAKAKGIAPIFAPTPAGATFDTV